MTTTNIATGAEVTVPAPAGRCLTCGEHVPYGEGRKVAAGVIHGDDRSCAAALRWLDEPTPFPRIRPAWESAALEPDGVDIGAPAC